MLNIVTQNKPTPKMRKWNKKTILGFLLLLVLVGIVALVLQSLTAPGNLKRSYEKLVFPASFHQSSAVFTPGSPMDVPPSWQYVYSVSGTRQSVYDALLKVLDNGGYKADPVTSSYSGAGAASGLITAKSSKRGLTLTLQTRPDPRSGDGSLISIDLNEHVDTVLVDVRGY